MKVYVVIKLYCYWGEAECDAPSVYLTMDAAKASVEGPCPEETSKWRKPLGIPNGWEWNQGNVMIWEIEVTEP